MDIYALLRPLLFKLDPEIAHYLTLELLSLSYKTGISGIYRATGHNKPVKVMGLEFKNPLGLAAGLDKNGDHIAGLADLGFGFIEIGTVTPKSQPGNPKPRLFRLVEQQAIINRMGFNNKGIEYLLDRLQASKQNGIIGINIGKNAATEITNAVEDYLIGLQQSYLAASYITINISSPNTKNLRQLQQANEIKQLLHCLKEEQLKLQKVYGKYTPIAVKIAPDLNAIEVEQIANILLAFEIDGVIATNTSLDRDSIKGHRLADEIGGLSGAPIKNAATQIVKNLAYHLQGKIPIIAVGGILSAANAQEKIQAGASLVQIYSGLIYKGPKLIKEILLSFK